MEKKFSPIFESLGSRTYMNAFVISSIFASFTAVFAVYYNNLLSTRLQKTDFCNSKNNLFCGIYSNKIISTANLFLKTLTATIIINIIFFFFFGWGGGSLNNFYIPTYKDFYSGIVIILILLLINFIFYYFILIHTIKKLPHLYHVLYGLLFEYGLVKYLHPDHKNMEIDRLLKKIDNMGSKEKVKYIESLNLIEKARIFNIFSPFKRAEIIKNMSDEKKMLYLSLLPIQSSSHTLSILSKYQ